MAEYKSFHYLMHSVPDAVKPVYVTSNPLSFDELYSPRDITTGSKDGLGAGGCCHLLYKGEKSYWRTRDRVIYEIYENRKHKLGIITCRNADAEAAMKNAAATIGVNSDNNNNKASSSFCYRTIFVDLPLLYFEIDAKARDSRDPLMKKKDKKIADDAALGKAAGEYLLARLNIPADPQVWPTVFGGVAPQEEERRSSPPQHTGSSEATTTTPSVTTDGTSSTTTTNSSSIPSNDTTASTKDSIDKERMCVLDKLSGDVYSCLEVPPPPNAAIILDGVPYLKLIPTHSTTTTDAISTSNDATTTGNDTDNITTNTDAATASDNNITPTTTTEGNSNSSSTSTNTATTTPTKNNNTKNTPSSSAAKNTSTTSNNNATTVYKGTGRNSVAVVKPTVSTPTPTNTSTNTTTPTTTTTAVPVVGGSGVKAAKGLKTPTTSTTTDDKNNKPKKKN